MSEFIAHAGIAENNAAPANNPITFNNGSSVGVPLSFIPRTIGISSPAMEVAGLDVLQPYFIYNGLPTVPMLFSLTVTIDTIGVGAGGVVNLFMNKTAGAVVTPVGAILVQALTRPSTTYFSLSLSSIVTLATGDSLKPTISFPNANAGAPVVIRIRDYTFTATALTKSVAN